MANSNWNELKEARQGIMLHYDGSTSDRGAVAWLRDDPRCKVSYNMLILDDGNIVPIAPLDKRAWHAGVCRSSAPSVLPYTDANSAFYGVSLAATDGDRCTWPAFRSLVLLCHTLFLMDGRWSIDEAHRIVGHETEAWPRGRKVDPTGSTPARPVLSVAAVRAALRETGRSQELWAAAHT